MFATKWFDTYADSNNSVRMAAYLRGLEVGPERVVWIVLIA